MAATGAGDMIVEQLTPAHVASGVGGFFVACAAIEWLLERWSERE